MKPMTGPYQWDAFLCHAREDRAAIARPLARELERRGLRVWIDESALAVGDRLLKTINDALLRSRHGVIIISDAFLQKSWPQRELESFLSRETPTSTIVLPVVHGFDVGELKKRLPLLSGSSTLTSADGIEHVAEQLAARIRQTPADAPRRRRTAGWPMRIGVLAALPVVAAGAVRALYLLAVRETPAEAGEVLPVVIALALTFPTNGAITRMLPTSVRSPRLALGIAVATSLVALLLAALAVAAALSVLRPEWL